MSFDLATYLAEVTRVHEVHGDEHVVPCICDVGSPKAHLWVNVRKAKAICYRCGLKHGDAVGIVAQLSDVDATKAYRLVRKGDAGNSVWRKMQASLYSEVPMELESEPTPPITLPAEFEPVTCVRDLPAYAVGRGIDLPTALAYGLGVCETGFYARRLVVPVWDAKGTLKSFVARLMRDGCQAPKVLYPKGSKTAQLLFNEPQAQAYDSIIVTEGVFDAMRVGPAAVALFGKHASRAQIERLLALGEKRRIVVMLDEDALAEAKQLTRDLGRMGGGEVWLARMPPGRHDPGECEQREILLAIKSAERVGDRQSRLIVSMGLRYSGPSAPQLQALTGGKRS